MRGYTGVMQGESQTSTRFVGVCHEPDHSTQYYDELVLGRPSTGLFLVDVRTEGILRLLASLVRSPPQYMQTWNRFRDATV